MRKLIRILAGTTLVGAFAFVSSPARAIHDDPAGTNWPCNPGTDPACVAAGASMADHEEQPEMKLVKDPNMACVVTGMVTVTPAYVPGGPQHMTTIPEVNDDPSHSHYKFLDTAIVCGDISKSPPTVERFAVDASGGNDGHIVDVFSPPVTATEPPPWCGPNGDCIELDCTDKVVPGDVDPFSKPMCEGDDHDFNDHHGSVNESAWSNGVDYAPGVVPDDDHGQCNDYVFPYIHKNKGNITATGTLAKPGPNKGWVKYVRIGPIVHAWGSFYDGPYADNKSGCANFAALLLFTPTATPDVFLLNGVADIGTGWIPLTP